MVVQLSELTKIHWNVHMKEVNFVLYKLYLNNYYQNRQTDKTGYCDNARKTR